MLVDARTLDPSSNLAVLVDIVGPAALARGAGDRRFSNLKIAPLLRRGHG
jgi:hypothetical protein